MSRKIEIRESFGPLRRKAPIAHHAHETAYRDERRRSSRSSSAAQRFAAAFDRQQIAASCGKIQMVASSPVQAELAVKPTGDGRRAARHLHQARVQCASVSG